MSTGLDFIMPISQFQPGKEGHQPKDCQAQDQIECKTDQHQIGELAIKAKAQAHNQVTDQRIDQVTQSNTASAEQSASASEELSSQAQQVKSMLARFKIASEERTMGGAGNAELLAMLRAELAQRGIRHESAGEKVPAVAKKPGATQGRPATPARPAPGRTGAGGNVLSSSGRTTPVNPADIISLDDDNFGKF